MRQYSFNFETFYYLELQTLCDICHLIRDSNTAIALNHDVIIRGCIIPFLRKATNAPKNISKDQVIRSALVITAKKIGVKLDNWESTPTDNIAKTTRNYVERLVTEKLKELDPQKREEILGIARNNLKESAKVMGVPLAGAGAVVAGELSGFGIYLATTTGLKALSLALSTTFSWGVYQSATAFLGIILGPIGWAIAGVSVVGSVIMAVHSWMKSKIERKLVLVVIALLFAIGESPFEFFGLSSNSSPEEVRKVYIAMMKTFHPDKLEKNLPEWIYDDFNEKLLRCQEAHLKIQRIFDNEEGKNG